MFVQDTRANKHQQTVNGSPNASDGSTAIKNVESSLTTPTNDATILLP